MHSKSASLSSCNAIFPACAGFCSPSLALAACNCSLHRPRPSQRPLTAGPVGRPRCKLQLQAAAAAEGTPSRAARCLLRLRLHLAHSSPKGVGQRLRVAACGYSLHIARPSAPAPWLHLAACTCTLRMARPRAAGLGCDLRLAVAPCTGHAQAPAGLLCACALQLHLAIGSPKGGLKMSTFN